MQIFWPDKPHEGAEMGEVRVKVKLTNALDEELLMQSQIQPQEVRTYEAGALVDAGAFRTIIPTDVVHRLGLRVRGHRVAEYADGRKETVGITGPMLVNVLGRDTLEEALILGDEVLLGQTVLEKLDLLVDCAGRRLIPNPAHPDQAVSKVK
jgi:hypothetical protein